MTTARPEGWYPDPSGVGRNRWWNGEHWTEHVDPPLGQSAPITADARAQQVGAYGSPVATTLAEFAGPPRFGRPPYAGFWSRVGAAIIDGLLIGIPLLVVSLLVLWPDLQQWSRDGGLDLASRTGPQATSLTGLDIPSYLLLHLLVVVGLSALVSGVYYVGLIAWRGATVGMSAVAIHVVDAHGQIPSLGRSLARWLATQAFAVAGNVVPFVGGLLPLLDDLWMLWDPQNQTLHDKIARTWVLRRV